MAVERMALLVQLSKLCISLQKTNGRLGTTKKSRISLRINIGYTHSETFHDKVVLKNIAKFTRNFGVLGSLILIKLH